MSAKAVCSWGNGPDVSVIVSRNSASGFDWTPYIADAGCFGLTIAEALILAEELKKAAAQAVEDKMMGVPYFKRQDSR